MIDDLACRGNAAEMYTLLLLGGLGMQKNGRDLVFFPVLNDCLLKKKKKKRTLCIDKMLHFASTTIELCFTVHGAFQVT